MPTTSTLKTTTNITGGPAFPLPHPGEHILHDCIQPLGLTVPKAAKTLGITKAALYNVIQGRSGVSPEMAVRLSQVFGSSPELWMNLQTAWDLQQVRRRGNIRLAPFPRGEAAGAAS